jgi:DNA-binding PadR family transcriptional regulator
LQGGAEGWPEDDDQAERQLMVRAFHRARGAILLELVDDVNGRRFSVALDETFGQRSDDYIRRLVLRSLDRVLRLTAGGVGFAIFDDIGVCLLENIDPTHMEYILRRLETEGSIEAWADQSGPGERTIQATARGLREADKLSNESKAPGFLLEETVAKVESCLNRYDPELVDSLRRQSARIAETKELGEHEVGEIAQACGQIIQDYLDLDALWEGIFGERPPKGNTRDRLRAILKARAPSETEADLLETLETYVVGWFGKLEKFIHKYRHLPGESDRRQAKRCVIYTYLLLADLSELLGL